MPPKLTEIIARETHGISYKTLKYSLDDSESRDDSEPSAVWEKSAESSQQTEYINLQPLAKILATGGTQRLTYFLDGSRRIFNVDEIAYSLSGGRRALYPILAGQVITGCCRRENLRLVPEKLNYAIVIALPDTADFDNNAKRGFWQALSQKLSAGLKPYGLEIAEVLSCKTGQDSRNASYDDRATAAIQSYMLKCEQELTASLARRKLLSSTDYLIKDGSLEYRQKSGVPLQNYRWVIGLSKTFNPSACAGITGKPDPGYIADLPAGHRTQAACYSHSMTGDTKFAVWYIRLHDRARTRSAFDGVVKVEKMLVTNSEANSGRMDSSEIDTLSAYILNERCPVCYGKDSRWTAHIYPVYLTEQYIKSKYLSTESFLHLF